LYYGSVNVDLKTYQLGKKEVYNSIISELKDGNKTIHEGLFDYYREGLHKSVNQVLDDDKYFDLQQKFTLNTSQFSAAKAFQVTQMVQRQARDKDGNLRSPEEFEKQARSVLGIFENYQKTEQISTIARARTAKQWDKFQQPSRLRLYPNMKWLPSRSATKRDEHIPFYNKVWAKDDPFWDRNTPGALWGCKCDWTDTDEPASGITDDTEAAKGLKGNPWKTGKIFSDDASYYSPASIKAIRDVEYKDALSTLRINVNADSSEIGDNIRTGRILLDNFKEMELSISGHFDAGKNPEYILNSMVADAKRVETWNVASSFKGAKEQKCEVVIIDLFKMEKYKPNVNEISKNIRNRYADFTNGSIKECYVVWKSKAVKIPSELFSGVTTQKEAKKVEAKIHKLLTSTFLS